MESTPTEADELMDEDYVQCLMSLDTNTRPGETEDEPTNNTLNNTSNINNILVGNIVKELPQMEEMKEPILGMEFESDEAAKVFYNEYARRLGFPFRVGRSRRSKGTEEVLIMKRFVCSKEGIYRKKSSTEEGMRKRERISMREGCKAMMEVIRESPSHWVVSKLEIAHNHRLGACSRVGYLRARGNLLEPSSFDTKPNLPDLLSTDMNDAQGLLDYFRKMQSEGPGFFYSVQVDSNSCVTNIFWADARSRAAYKYFGDAVMFDTTYKKNKYMMPFVTFSGVNHHLQPVLFGCAILMDQTEFSFTRLFETWLEAMGGRAPLSLLTDQNRALATAVARVFPNTCHRYCKWLILSRTKQKLSHVYNSYPTLRSELESCVIESETINTFEANWASIIEKYDLKKNTWLQALYNIRQKWVPLYLKDVFFADTSPTQKLETMNDFYKKHFNTKTQLKVFLTQFDLAMANRYEQETQADLDSLATRPALKTASLIEKQAATVYTKAIFEKFQEEFVQSLGYIVQKVKDGNVSKFSVTRDEYSADTFSVTYNSSRKTASCTCKNFEFCGIICRHILGVLLVVDPRVLPEECFLKRWTKSVKNEAASGQEDRCCNTIGSRYGELCWDAIRFAERGASTAETYRASKDILERAYEEILNFERNSNRGMQRDPININEEITIDDAMNDQLRDSERKVTNLLGQLLSSSWSPV